MKSGVVIYFNGKLVMDIQKEREAFEAWHKDHHHKQIGSFDGEYYTNCYEHTLWVGWQAAKAVPEGFILMPKEPEKDTLIAIASVCIGDEFADLDEAKELYKAMIEAQEQVG